MLLQSEIWAIVGKNEWGLNLAFTLSCSRYTSQTSQQTSFLLEILILAGRTFLTGQNDSLVLLKETLRILPERSACKTKKNSVLPWIWIVTICNEYPLAESYRFSYLIMPVWTPSHKGYVWNVNHFFAVVVHLIIWIEWFTCKIALALAGTQAIPAHNLSPAPAFPSYTFLHLDVLFKFNLTPCTFCLLLSCNQALTNLKLD